MLARKSLGAAEFSAHPGGHHLWLRLPREWSRAGFAAQVLDGGVAIVSSDVFSVRKMRPMPCASRSARRARGRNWCRG